MGEIIVRKIRGMNWKTKISLVLIFTMVFSTFMYQGWYKPKVSDAAPTQDGRILYSINSTTPQNRSYAVSNNTFNTQTATLLGGTPTWMVMKAAPARDEMMAGYVSGATLYIYMWNGSTWAQQWTATVPNTGINGRPFDIVYENVSGRAVVVYSTGTFASGGAELASRYWTYGTGWSTAANITSTNLTSATAAYWVKMTDRPGTDNILLGASLNSTGANTGSQLAIWEWNSTTGVFGTELGVVTGTASLCATAAGAIPVDPFHLAYETLTGDALIAYVQGSTTAGYYIRERRAGVLQTAASMATYTQPGQIIISPDPTTNNIVIAYQRNASTNVYGRIWNGNAASAATTISTGNTELNPAANKRWIAAKYVSVGGSPMAVVMWGHSTNTNIGYNVYTGSWGTAGVYNKTVASAIQWMDLDLDPNGTDTLMLTYSDAASDLYAKQIVVGLGGALTFSDPAGNPITATLTATTGIQVQNFDFAFNRIDTSPPVTSGLTFDGPVYTTFVGSPFTFHGGLTDAVSPVTSCEVCVKNGSECTNADTWVTTGVTLSGSSPTWTCTATGVTTYSNGGAITSGDNVYVDVRGTSAGGQNVDGGTAVTKTMDKTGPTDGAAALTVTPGTDQNVLSWPAASDANSGLRTGNIYDVRALGGTTPPSCTTGTSVYAGDSLTFTHIATPVTGGYSYRVCAYDNVNMPSTGKTGTGLPTWSSTIATCGRCHGYPPLGGTRNNPEGAVVGSHSVHTNVCSVCHVVPGGTAYAHRDGNINMKTGATGISGGFYDKANTGVFVSPDDETFAQTNSPTTRSCRNVSCHGGNNPTPQWGFGTVGCVDCHNGTITRTVVAGTLDNVVAEFNKTWSHKRSAGGNVTNGDCIVCHLEGNSTSQRTSAYHADGNIDLRDPDGASRETAITNMTGGAFTFTKFSTSYASGVRYTDGHMRNTADNVITQKFCLKCHDANGATNAGAQVSGGTQYKPFNTTISGAGYITPISAGVAGGVVNVDRMFATTNKSLHPVKGPLTRDYATPARFNAPYNNFTRTAGTASTGIVLNCFDCHNVPGASPLTTRTVSAHGNAETVRGTIAVSGTPSSTNAVTLCNVCHYQYNTQTQPNHGTGSATGNLDRSEKTPFMQYGCNRCHSSGYIIAVQRPKRSEDVHGFDATWPAATTIKQSAFIRNTDTLDSHQPAQIGSTTYTPQCDGMFGDSICDESGPGNGRQETYSPGGTY